MTNDSAIPLASQQVFLRPSSREERTHGFFDDWTRATMGFSLEEMGAYAALCAYAIGKRTWFTDIEARHAAYCSTRKWRKIRDALLASGAIVAREDGAMLPAFLIGRLYKSGYLYIKNQISSKLRWEVFRRDGYTCLSCGSKEDLTADHVIAEINGGETILDNLQTLCRPCNSGKGAQ